MRQESNPPVISAFSINRIKYWQVDLPCALSRKDPSEEKKLAGLEGSATNTHLLRRKKRNV